MAREGEKHLGKEKRVGENRGGAEAGSGRLQQGTSL